MKGNHDYDRISMNDDNRNTHIKHTILDINIISPSDYLYYCSGMHSSSSSSLLLLSLSSLSSLLSLSL